MKAKLVLSVAVLLAHISLAADLDAKTTARAERTAKRMRKQIVSELKKRPDHPWAGEHYAGDGLGVNTSLSIAPQSGFVFEMARVSGII